MAASGYVKALSDRRSHQLANEKILRAAVEDVLLNADDLPQARRMLQAALRQAPLPGKPMEYMPSEHTYVPKPRRRLPCGHYQSSAMISEEGTAFCVECAREAGHEL
jgi:hypothetical protein